MRSFALRKSSGSRILVWTLASFGATYLSEAVAREFTLPGGVVAVIWPASGFALAIAVIVSPWTALGAVAADAVFQHHLVGTPTIAMLSGLALGLQVLLIAVAIRRFLGGSEALATPLGVLRYTTTIVLGALLSSTIGVTVLHRAGYIPHQTAAVAWLTWWGSDIVAMCLLTPFFFAWRTSTPPVRGDTREAIALGLLTVLVIAIVLVLPSAHSPFLLPMLSLPLVAWAAFRFGSRAVATVSLSLGVATFAQLVVPWRSAAADTGALLEAQLFITLTAGTGSVVAAYVRQESRRLREASAREFAAVDDARNRLLSTFAHELNNPLTPMILQLELLRDDPDQPLPPAHAKAIAVIERNTRRLSKLVADLRDVSHIQRDGGIRLRPSQMDAADVARDVVESYRSSANAAGIELRLDVRSAPVFADEDRLAQVLSNLLDNALKYSPPGRHVEVRVRAEESDAVVEVRDLGVGLTQDQVARLFKPFGQVQEEMAQKSGTGLGLYIARGIVEGHGGRLDCRSDGPGQGATFSARLPRQSVAQVGPAPWPAARGMPA